MPNGTLPKKWHLKCHESVHILTGLYDHLKEYKKLFSKELVNSKCLKKLKIKFWENEYITKKVKFSWTNCLYIWDQQKILILLKILLEVAYFFKFFQYRKGALWSTNFHSNRATFLITKKCTVKKRAACRPHNKV